MEEEQINEQLIAQLLRGERPEGMNYKEFRIKRKAIDIFIKKRNKGKFIYISKEYVEEENPETGKKQMMVRTYKPYKKKKDE